MHQEMSELLRNVRIVRVYPLTVLFTFTMVIINSILGLISERAKRARSVPVSIEISDTYI